MNNNCLFCKIAAGQIPVRIVDQDDRHMAFLTIYPNTPGCTVVIPRAHLPSYFANCDRSAMDSLVEFAQGVARLLDDAFPDVGRTALVFEGYGVDHLHAKLFPMHGTPKPNGPWREIKSSINRWIDRYEGYISSHDCNNCTDAELDAVHRQILASKSSQRTPRHGAADL